MSQPNSAATASRNHVDLTRYGVRSWSRLSIKHPQALEQAPTSKFGRTHQEPRTNDSILLSTQAHASRSFPPFVSSLLHSYLSCASIYDEIFAGNLVPIFISIFSIISSHFFSSLFCLLQNHAIFIYCGLLWYYFSYSCSTVSYNSSCKVRCTSANPRDILTGQVQLGGYECLSPSLKAGY